MTCRVVAPWYATLDNVVDLLEWLIAAGQAPHDVVYFLRKPWKYGKEWDQYTSTLVSPAPSPHVLADPERSPVAGAGTGEPAPSGGKL